MWKLLIADIKMLLRNKQALFWSLVFPLLFLVAFGLFMGGDQSITFTVAVFDESTSDIGTQFVDTLKEIDVIELSTDYATVDEARAAISAGDLGYAVVLPASLQNIQSDTPHTITLYVDEQKAQYNQILHGILTDIFTSYNLGITQSPRLFSVEQQGLVTKEVTFFDFILMGILGMGLMTSAIIGMTTSIVNYREKKILKRLLATPVKRWEFVAAEIISFLLLALAQAAVILIFGKVVFGAHIYGSIPLLFALVVVGVGIFLSLAFALSGTVQTVRAAEGLSNGVSMPMMFLSGVFFPIDSLPAIVGTIVKYLPLTPLLQAFRAVGLEEKGIADITSELMILGLWFVVAFAVAVFTFRFEKR